MYKGQLYLDNEKVLRHVRQCVSALKTALMSWVTSRLGGTYNNISLSLKMISRLVLCTWACVRFILCIFYTVHLCVQMIIYFPVIVCCLFVWVNVELEVSLCGHWGGDRLVKESVAEVQVVSSRLPNETVVWATTSREHSACVCVGSLKKY